jgi:hypothetical protein
MKFPFGLPIDVGEGCNQEQSRRLRGQAVDEMVIP